MVRRLKKSYSAQGNRSATARYIEVTGISYSDLEIATVVLML